MHARTAMGIQVSLGWWVAALCCGQGSATEDAPPRPNVLFIAIDDLNDWVGCLGGHPQSSTPNIDRLANRGVLFTNAHCPAPLCNASRAALLSGAPPHESGVYENNQPWRPAIPHVATLPEHFRQSGYHAAAGGKIFHGSFNEPGAFSEYWRRPGDPSPNPVDLRRPKGNMAWGPVDAPNSVMGDHKLVDWAISKLREPRNRPQLLMVGFVKPHLAWFAPREHFDALPLNSIELPPTRAGDLDDVPTIGRKFATGDGLHAAVLKAGLHREGVRAYLAAVRFVDRQVGRLLDALDQSPQGGETIVVLWSDHGWHLGEKEHWKKFTLWERSTRVPLTIVAPGVAKPGARCNRSVSLMSLYPTLVELCGLPPAEAASAPSLAPLLKDPDAVWPHAALTTYRRGNHSVKWGDWRYIRYQDGSEELYDLAVDPHEWTNRADDPSTAAVKEKLRTFLPTRDAPEARRAPGRKEDV